MNYDELCNFAANFPKIPQRELKCHPSVTEALRREHGPVDVVCPEGFAQLRQDLLSIPIREDESMLWGEWQIREDGAIVAAGSLYKNHPALLQEVTHA